MIANNFSNLPQHFQYDPELWSNIPELLNVLQSSGEFTGFHFVSIMLQQLTAPVVFVTVLTAFSLFVVVPANVITAVVIIKNKDLWTCSNVVLAINAIVQATGSLIYLVVRWGGMGIFPFFDQSQADAFFILCWWSYFIMMRTGNNRLVISSYVFW